MKLTGFQVYSYRNIIDSGWIETNKITAFVGQNEAGKSNLFEALYCLNPMVDGATYNIDEDWPVDKWEGKKNAKGTLVCRANFLLDQDEIASLYKEAANQTKPSANANQKEDTGDEEEEPKIPPVATVLAYKHYGYGTGYSIGGFEDGALDEKRAKEWAKNNIPKFVYISDYEMSGAQVELDQLKTRWNNVGKENRYKLSNEDQTILIILDLANIELDEFLNKGATPEGRTTRSFDKRSASKYLTNQFGNLWQQKEVKFDIEIDGTTLNIFAEDVAIGMPVRLHRRSTGFRWYVSFAWKFTHATDGQYSGCILLLEEPGVHLHFSGQRDLLRVFERLAEKNTILYTTHLASMVDLANPERVRIVESEDNHLAITHGIVSSQRGPMAVIEQSLGLTGDQSGMLGNRQVLIVEGGSDALILHKLSGLLNAEGKEGLSDKIYLWPAHTASKTPMYAAFAIGQKWDAAVLLDTDEAGWAAKKKIDDLYLSKLAISEAKYFRILMLGNATGGSKTDFAIEDIFPDEFYLDCTNSAFGLAIKIEDLPIDGSDMITKKIESVLRGRYGQKELDKRRIFAEMLKKFDTWKKTEDIPGDGAVKATNLFRAINSAFNNR